MSSTIEKECEVIILPSNKESILSMWGNEKYPMDELFLSTPQNRERFDEKELQYVNIYILSDCAINKGDWFIQTDRLRLGPIQATVDFGYDPLDVSKKIIATTDLLLSPPTYKQGVGVFSTKVPELKESLIGSLIESYNRGECMDSVIVNFEQYDIKNEALNKIRKLYHPETKHNYTYYPGEGGLMEQISFDIKQIIEDMEEELNRLNKK